MNIINDEITLNIILTSNIETILLLRSTCKHIMNMLIRSYVVKKLIEYNSVQVDTINFCKTSSFTDNCSQLFWDFCFAYNMIYNTKFDSMYKSTKELVHSYILNDNITSLNKIVALRKVHITTVLNEACKYVLITKNYTKLDIILNLKNYVIPYDILFTYAKTQYELKYVRKLIKPVMYTNFIELLSAAISAGSYYFIRLIMLKNKLRKNILERYRYEFISLACKTKDIGFIQAVIKDHQNIVSPISIVDMQIIQSCINQDAFKILMIHAFETNNIYLIEYIAPKLSHCSWTEIARLLIENNKFHLLQDIHKYHCIHIKPYNSHTYGDYLRLVFETGIQYSTLDELKWIQLQYCKTIYETHVATAINLLRIDIAKWLLYLFKQQKAQNMTRIYNNIFTRIVGAGKVASLQLALKLLPDITFTTEKSSNNLGYIKNKTVYTASKGEISSQLFTYEQLILIIITNGNKIMMDYIMQHKNLSGKLNYNFIISNITKPDPSILSHFLRLMNKNI